MLLIAFSACRTHIDIRVHIFSYKWKKCIEWINATVRVYYFCGQVHLCFNGTNLLEENARTSIIYCDRCINALRRGASRKLSIKTLRSAISLHPHYSIVTIARLRQLFSGRFVATAWRIEDIARGINSCINYREYLSPSFLDIHHIRDAYIFRAIATARTAFSSDAAISYAERLAKKRRLRVTVINFTETDNKKGVTHSSKKWIKFTTNNKYSAW